MSIIHYFDTSNPTLMSERHKKIRVGNEFRKMFFSVRFTSHVCIIEECLKASSGEYEYTVKVYNKCSKRAKVLYVGNCLETTWETAVDFLPEEVEWINYHLISDKQYFLQLFRGDKLKKGLLK